MSAGLDVIAHGEEYFFTFFYDGVEAQFGDGLVPAIAETRIPEAVRLTRKAGAAVTPNLSFVAMTRAQLDDLPRMLGDPEARFLHPDVLDMWRRQNPTTRPDLPLFDRRERSKYGFLQRLTRALSDAGVPLLLGTDASAPGLYPGMAAHVELGELVGAGLTPYEAIATGTRTAGALIGRHVPETPFGTIAPGNRADLILLRGNPLDDVANASAIEGVLARGTWFTRRELQGKREHSRNRPTVDRRFPDVRPATEPAAPQRAVLPRGGSRALGSPLRACPRLPSRLHWGNAPAVQHPQP